MKNKQYLRIKKLIHRILRIINPFSKLYSQNNEERLIKRYFKGRSTGRVLDIGANDGKTLSNSRYVLLNGWEGVLIEPSKTAFKKLEQEYRDNPRVELINKAIGEKNGQTIFYESGTLLHKGDHGLLSTISKEELDRWGDKVEFSRYEVSVITFDSLLELLSRKTFNLVTIDVEGLDYQVLSQIDLDKIGCEMLIVENNAENEEKFIQYCSKFGLKLISRNYENLIFQKPIH